MKLNLSFLADFCVDFLALIRCRVNGHSDSTLEASLVVLFLAVCFNEGSLLKMCFLFRVVLAI